MNIFLSLKPAFKIRTALNAGVMKINITNDVISGPLLESDLPTITSFGKVSNSATTGTVNNIANTLVLRNSNGAISNQTMINNPLKSVYHAITTTTSNEVTLNYNVANVFIIDILKDSIIKFSNMLSITDYGETVSRITIYVKLGSNVTTVTFDKTIGWKNDYNPFDSTNISQTKNSKWHKIEIERLFFSGNEIFFGTHVGYY